MKHAGQSPYSRNEIVIEMESPEIDDINLVELPGFDSVNTTNNAVLNELLDFYCKNDNVIILSVIPATEDIRKEPTYELVKKYDVHQTKTIGFFFFLYFFFMFNSMGYMQSHYIHENNKRYTLFKF